MAQIKELHSQQYDFYKDIELVLAKVEHEAGTVFVLYKYHTKTDKYEYGEQHFNTLKVAFECFDKAMESAPIEQQLKEVQ
jgi:hypothetical protein